MPALYVFLMDYYFKRKILHLFFPNRCPICQELINANDRFCIECTDKLKMYNRNFEISEVKKFFACFDYDDNIKPAIFQLKSGICGNSDYAFGSYLAEVLRNENISTDIIVPVPLSLKSMRKRGYNQSELIAKILSIELNIPVCCAVRKIRETKEQKNLEVDERKSNLKDAFDVINPETVRGKRILLVDDICTTGSTFHEIALVLKRNGAEEIFCASVCKA